MQKWMVLWKRSHLTTIHTGRRRESPLAKVFLNKEISGFELFLLWLVTILFHIYIYLLLLQTFRSTEGPVVVTLQDMSLLSCNIKNWVKVILIKPQNWGENENKGQHNDVLKHSYLFCPYFFFTCLMRLYVLPFAS